MPPLNKKKIRQSTYSAWLDRFDVAQVERAQRSFRSILRETDNRTLDRIGRHIIRLRDGKIDKKALRREALKLYNRQFGQRNYTLQLRTIENRIIRSFERPLSQVPLGDGSGLPLPRNTRKIANDLANLSTFNSVLTDRNL